MLPVHRPQRNWGARIHDVRIKGLSAIVLENDLLRVTFLVEKGTDVVEINYKPRDLDFTWLTPDGIRNPTSYLSSSPTPGQPFDDNYPGGWQEIFPSAGVPWRSNGTNYGQHAEVFALPWDAEIVEDTSEAVAVRFSVHPPKTAVRIEKTVRLVRGESRFRIQERLINRSDVTITGQWGHHITFGLPFMQPGARITVPEGLRLLAHPQAEGSVRRVDTSAELTWPVTRGFDGEPVDLSLVPERGTTGEMLFLEGYQSDVAWYRIEDEARGVGARVTWDAHAMPYLWVWQEFGGSTGSPWFGRANVIGLEPFSSLPNSYFGRDHENPTSIQLEGQGERTFWLTYEVTDRGRG